MGGRRAAAAAAVFLLVTAACSGSPEETAPDQASTQSPAVEDPTCPLSGLTPPPGTVLERPAVAVKIENNPVAYPLSGLEKAEIVYEEQVEGGMTRFLALYHCTNTPKAGPVRSARSVDPAIMTPTTRILAAAGGNDIVRDVLSKGKIFIIDEQSAGEAMRRFDRPGVTFEHTLYGNTKALRKLGAREFSAPPPAGQFDFGKLEGKSKKARKITLQFGSATTIEYRWAKDSWRRFERGQPFETEAGQIEVDNVIIEEHVVNNSKTIIDIAGNPSIEIADVIGSGRAVLFRDGRAIRGRWVRKKQHGPVVYKSKDGKEMVLAPGTTWIALLPNDKGEVKGSFSVAPRS